MIEYITLGIIQGIGEWLPVSSEGLILLAKANIFHSSGQIESSIEQALFLHFGTFVAALIYFRQDVKMLLKAISNYRSQSSEIQNIFKFLFVSTLISGAIGLALIKALSHFAAKADSGESLITLLVGCLLLITAFLELRAKRSGCRTIENLNLFDGILLGIVQGFAALPGLSRSGLTVSALLLRRVENRSALRLSFLMSLPIVLLGNLVLNFQALTVTPEAAVGLFFSFAFGLATIHLLLKVAEKINFGYFVLLFGVLTILSVFL